MSVSSSYWWLNTIISHKMMCVMKWDPDRFEMIVGRLQPGTAQRYRAKAVSVAGKTPALPHQHPASPSLLTLKWPITKILAVVARQMSVSTANQNGHAMVAETESDGARAPGRASRSSAHRESATRSRCRTNPKRRRWVGASSASQIPSCSPRFSELPCP